MRLSLLLELLVEVSPLAMCSTWAMLGSLRPLAFAGRLALGPAEGLRGNSESMLRVGQLHAPASPAG